MTELNATSASFATKLLYVASKQYGGPFCGMSSKNDQNIEDVRFWVSGVSVGTVGVAGKLTTKSATRWRSIHSIIIYRASVELAVLCDHSHNAQKEPFPQAAHHSDRFRHDVPHDRGPVHGPAVHHVQLVHFQPGIPQVDLPCSWDFHDR